jgi:predicted membrane-bound mannosyltransferase
VWSLYKATGGGGAWRSAPALALAAVAVAVCTYQAWVVSFREYDNDQYPYVYAHTRRQFLTLVGEIERLVARAGTGTETRLATTSPGPGTDSYWPLPWYLNRYRSVGYFAQLPADAANLSIVVGNATQDAQLRATLGATHRKVGPTYPLRPGVDLVLYAQRGLTDR